MLRLVVGFILLLNLVGASAFAGRASGRQTPARNPAKLPFSYKIFRLVGTDLDKTLIKQGYTPRECTYWDFSEKKEIRYTGSVGVCMFKTFADLMSDSESNGRIRVSFDENGGRIVNGTLTWRPTKAGWNDFLSEFGFQYFEYLRVRVHQIFKNDIDSKPLPFKENFLGRMILDFDSPPKILLGWSEYDQVEFQLFPTNMEEGVTQYDGLLHLSRKTVMVSDRRMTFDFKTNWNITKGRRPFDFKGEGHEYAP